MEGVPNRQVNFPGTRTSRSKFPSIPSNFPPIRTPLAPSPDTRTTPGGVARGDRTLPTPVAYAGVARRAELPLMRCRVACRRLDVEPNGAKNQILPHKLPPRPCEPR
eukprot:6604572-Prymnesium_polylepis.1